MLFVQANAWLINLPCFENVLELKSLFHVNICLFNPTLCTIIISEAIPSVTLRAFAQQHYFTNHPTYPRAISVGIKCRLRTGYKIPSRCKMRTRNYGPSVKHRPGIKCGLHTMYIKTVLKR